MICPKCKTEFKVTNTFAAGASSRTQRLECPKCNTVATVQLVLVNINPRYGQGAESLAKRLKRVGNPTQGD